MSVYFNRELSFPKQGGTESEELTHVEVDWLSNGSSLAVASKYSKNGIEGSVNFFQEDVSLKVCSL